MEHAQDGPKPTEKAQDLPARRNASQRSPSGAHALLNLQRAAGNQAVAKMLTTSRASRQREPRSLDPPSTELQPPLNVQRTLVDELEKQRGFGYANVSDEDLAKFILASVSGKVPKEAEKGKTERSGAKSGLEKTGEAPKKLKLDSVKELDARYEEVMEKRRGLGLAPPRVLKGEELERRARSENLERLEKETDLLVRRQAAQDVLTPKALSPRDAAIEKREKEVKFLEDKAEVAKRERELKGRQQELSPEEEALRDREEELKDLEEEQTRKETLGQEKRRAERAAKKLNPVVAGGKGKDGRKTLGQLLETSGPGDIGKVRRRF